MKTAAILLVAVTLSSSLFLQSSAAPDPLLSALNSGLGNLLEGVGNTAAGVATVAEETIGALVGKGVETCLAYVLFLKDLSVVLKAAQERLYELLTDVTKEIDVALANATGALKELLTKLNAPLKVLLEALPELLKALEATVLNPTEENFNKVEANIKQLEPMVAKLTEIVEEDTTGMMSFSIKSLSVAIGNSFKDGFGAIKVVVESLRRNKGD